MRLALKNFYFIFKSKPQETTDIRCRLQNALLSKFRVKDTLYRRGGGGGGGGEEREEKKKNVS